jgi:hypothetical protein
MLVSLNVVIVLLRWLSRIHIVLLLLVHAWPLAGLVRLFLLMLHVWLGV